MRVCRNVFKAIIPCFMFSLSLYGCSLSYLTKIDNQTIPLVKNPVQDETEIGSVESAVEEDFNGRTVLVSVNKITVSSEMPNKETEHEGLFCTYPQLLQGVESFGQLEAYYQEEDLDVLTGSDSLMDIEQSKGAVVGESLCVNRETIETTGLFYTAFVPETDHLECLNKSSGSPVCTEGNITIEVSGDKVDKKQDDVGKEESEEVFELLKVNNRKVDSFIKYFQSRGKKTFSRWLARSGKYLPLVKRMTKDSGLPEEIAYLPLIESGFDTSARSRAGAVGMWQFMESTAKKYGLRVDWWIDERKDPEKSTHAALMYLKDLYGSFGSWPLALAAYNAGEGKVRRTIRKYKTDDYWKISHKRSFSRETKNYIPKFVAALLIADNPARYGFADMEYVEPVKYDEVKLRYTTDLKVVARAAGVGLREIEKLNPALKRWFTPPNYTNYEIKIPYGRKAEFIENISKVPPSRRVVYRVHYVRYGDTLSHIAKRYNTSVNAIAYLNKIRNPRRIRAGARLVVPVRAGRIRSAKAGGKVLKGSIKKVSLHKIIYTVKKGDTLWDIARNFDVDISSLAMWNGIGVNSLIFPGDRISIRL